MSNASTKKRSSGGVDAPRIVAADASVAGFRLLGRFYREAYVEEFPDPDERESLAQLRAYLRLKECGWYGENNYHVLVACHGDRVLGGAVLDYLALPSAAIIEFLFVLPEGRGRGLGKALLHAGIAAVRADARAAGRRLQALVAEMNDPYRRPHRPDNMDPFDRARIWGAWGFQKVLCPYAQPALSRAQRPVVYLTLICRVLARPKAATLDAAWLQLVVAEYMRWGMRIDEPERNPEFAVLCAFLQGRRRVPMLPLWTSVGDDPQGRFEAHPVAAPGSEFDAVMKLLRTAIPTGRLVPVEAFTAALRTAAEGGPAYHLWRLTAPGCRGAQGAASFFSLHSCGFGGYLTLARPLRGRGLLPIVMARMEARMMADGVATPGWFIECGDDSAHVFMRQGFAELPLEWRPPMDTATHPAERLKLLYKPFGAAYPPVVLATRFVRRALCEILEAVYGCEDGRKCATYRLACASLRARDGLVLPTAAPVPSAGQRG
jgi:GNAT superfamily N-acetyltransferase